MTANKPEIIGYVPTKDGKLRCGEDGFCLDEYTDQLRDNPAGLKLEPVILFREYEALQAECVKLRKDAKRYVPLNEAVQRAAAELPEVWEIHLCVVRDSGSVDLIGPDGTEDFYTDNERLDYTVIDALEFAIDAAMQRANPC